MKRRKKRRRLSHCMYPFCILGMLPQPSVDSFACMLPNLRKSRHLAVHVIRVYAYIGKIGMEAHFLVGNPLVSMLAELGCIIDAQHVFDRLLRRLALSWNSLITGYIECGRTYRAFDLYQDMQNDVCVHPSNHTFVALLKACIKLKDLEEGFNIHAEIARTGLLERDLFVGNTLVDMYAKCGSLVMSKQVFSELPQQNEVSWNVLMSGYVEHGLGEDALELYEQMTVQGVTPNAVTFLLSLKACGSTGAAYKGLEMHCEIERRGMLERHLSIGGALVDTYAKCGWLAKGKELFVRLASRNVVLWTSLIGGYAEHGHGDEALNCFEEMQLEGVSPDAVTFVWTLKACGSTKTINKCLEIHAEIERKGLLDGNVYVGSTLVDTYARCGLIAKAQETLVKLSARSIASWNALISGYAEHGYFEEVLECFDQMQLEGIQPDSVTFVCGLKACGSLGDSVKGAEIHVEIDRNGLLETDLIVGSTLVDMYARCGFLVRAQQMFDRLSERDVVTWNALIMGYAECGQAEDALTYFEQMQAEGLTADIATFICILKACGNVGAVDIGQELHGEIERKGLLERDIVVGNTLIDMYAKWGWLSVAQRVFDKLPHRDTVSWNSLIAGYGQLGESEIVTNVFNKMLQGDTAPDPVTFLIVLNACSRTCLFNKSQTYFESMSKDYGIAPAREHYSCMADLLGRAGQLDKLVAMVKKMPICPDISLWHSVLSACKNWGNVKLGEQAFEHALSVDEDDAAAFVLMSHIYASAGMQKEVNELKALRLSKRAW